MQRVNEFSFYELASSVHPLTEIEKQLLSQSWYLLWNARNALNQILALRPLTVCVNAANKLRTAIDNVVPDRFEDLAKLLPAEEGVDEDPIPPCKIHSIEESAKEFETILAAECHVLDTYFVSKKGAYSTADLIDNAHHQIPASMRNDLPALTKADIDQAGTVFGIRPCNCCGISSA